jgi:hypothetical protein
LRTDEKLFRKVDELRWEGPTAVFEKFTRDAEEPKLLQRAQKLAAKISR